MDEDCNSVLKVRPGTCITSFSSLSIYRLASWLLVPDPCCPLILACRSTPGHHRRRGRAQPLSDLMGRNGEQHLRT